MAWQEGALEEPRLCDLFKAMWAWGFLVITMGSGCICIGEGNAGEGGWL